MSTYNPTADLEIAHAMADAARSACLPHFRTGPAVENKLSGGFDPVTVADRASEQAMRAVLAERAPADGILGEEFGETAGGNGRRWVLDPIDGTRAFIAGLPSWTMLIALEYRARPVIGLIDQPHIGERFVGWPGGAEYRRGGQARALKTRPTRRLGDAIMSSTDAFLFEAAVEAEAFECVRRSVRLCRFGFDAYAYAMLAAGGVDLVIESGLQIYDVQAFIPVVEGAGGVVTNWSGGDASEGGQVVAAATPELLDEALRLLAPAAL
jgi:histidinol phosphatase-like enzyme (inositol monophosphatase family)